MPSETAFIDAGDRALRSTAPIEHATASTAVGVVVIGRNEGERLRRCLQSVVGGNRVVVYVDSGSIDGSVDLALANGAAVVALDMGRPFTAARARNAGFAQLVSTADDSLRYVQFVDGDCEVMPGWFETASSFLDQHANVTCVCGRLRERHPERSVYNLLCDMEWDRPTGEAQACGGIAMLRADVFAALGGFREDIVAGEEPELCSRIRARGGKVWRLAQHMAWHDADMQRFGQWWKRSRRVGFAYAQSIWLHGTSSERIEWIRLLRPWLWVVGIPTATLIFASVWGVPAWFLLLAYPASAMRAAQRAPGPWQARAIHSAFQLTGKLPELLGEFQFFLSQIRGRASSMKFDYKK